MLSDIFEELKDIVKSLKKYHFVPEIEFIKIIRERFSLYTRSDIYFDTALNQICIHHKKFIELFNQIEDTKKLFEEIANLSISNIQIGQEKISFQKEKIYVDMPLLEFDYKSLQDKINMLSLKECSDKENLEKAFLMNKNEEYEASYNEFKQLAKSAFRNRDYSTWYIAQFNKKNFVFYNLAPLDQEQEQRIETYLQEMRALDLEEEYLKLPKLIRKELKLLKDFGSFLDKELIETYRLREAILEAYVNQKNGGFNFDNNINIILNKLYKNLALRSAYHLIDNRKEFFQKALEAILIFLSYKDSQKAPFEKQPKDKSSNVSLNDFIYDLLIYYFDTKDLKTLLDEYYKDRIFDFDTPKKIKNIFINICQRFITLGFYASSASRFFNNFLILTAHISLKQDIFETIIKHFKEKLEHQIVSINEYENLNYFIVKQWNKNRQNIDFKSLKEIILAYMNLFICGKFNFYTLKIPQQTQTFENMFAILIENKDLFKVDEKEVIKLYIKKISHFDTYTKSIITRSFLCPIKKLCDKKLQDMIERFIDKILKLKDELDDFESIQLTQTLFQYEIKNKSWCWGVLKEMKAKYKDLINSNENKLAKQADQICILSTIEEIEKYLNTNKRRGDSI